jgi:hypothetical protein
MRSFFTVTLAAALVMAGIPTPPSYAQSAVTPVRLDVATPAPAFVEMFQAFPKGGEQLSNRVADFIVSNPKLAPALANYLVNAHDLSRGQKIAAEHGFAAALKRLGINAADLGRPPPPVERPVAVVDDGFNWWWVVAAAALIGGIVACALECFKKHHDDTVVFVSPN